MKYKLTKAEQETVINFDNELDNASVYTHDSRLIKKPVSYTHLDVYKRQGMHMEST